jgi:predicted alternative tryptophan synthase beta-subunit
VIGGPTDVMQLGTYSTVNEIYSKTVRVCTTKLMPFLKMHYFGQINKDQKVVNGGYHAHKKAVVISLLTRMKVYDEALFTNFMQHLSIIMDTAQTNAQFTTSSKAES